MLRVDVHIILALIIKIAAEDCLIDNRTPENAWEKKLHYDLKCNYDSKFTPLRSESDSVNVTVGLVIKDYDFDDREEIVDVYSWMHFTWHDFRFKWDPKDYDGISDIQMNSYRIWTPNLKLMNSAQGNDQFYFMCVCSIKSDGNVVCIPKISHETACSSKLHNWPYDTKKCIFEFSYNQNKRVNFYTDDHAVSSMGSETNDGWNAVNIWFEKDSKAEVLRLGLLVERESAAISAVIIFPSAIVPLLMIVSFTIELNDINRLLIAFLGLLCDFLILSEINEEIPKHSVDCPFILKFVRFSIILSAFNIVLTFILKKIYCKETLRAPIWICSFNDFVLSNNLRWLVYQLWLMNESNQSQLLKCSDENRQEWRKFVIIINNYFTFISVVLLGVSFLVYMPH